MLREQLLEQLNINNAHWDICIIGGGATGLGAAVDAASRGYRTILLEKNDYAKGTSSRSTKLVHGGVRYLQQGNIRLVMEALRERGILKKNAAHLVKNQSFIVPNYKWWEGPYYGLGLKVYDWMSGALGLGPSQLLSKAEVLALAPTLDGSGLRGGVRYHDGQFDDARLAINLAQTAAAHGALVLNYIRVDSLIKKNGKITGVRVHDEISGNDHEIFCKVVINATGVFSDQIQQMDEPEKVPTIAPSQGIHLVFDKAFLPGDAAIMVPHTDDGRVLFAVPWHNRLIVGTTDTPVPDVVEEPVPLQHEVDFLLKHISRYLSKDPDYSDIRSMFAGLRPLVNSSAKKTAEISREHSILVSPSGLISIIGGKWTTYRKMAEDVINVAAQQGGLTETPSITISLPIHGCLPGTDYARDDYYYGTDIERLHQLYTESASYNELLHPSLPYRKAAIVFAVRNEYCMTVEDALMRRTRAVLLDASAAIECAPEVARLMSAEMKQPPGWAEKQVEEFTRVAKKYLPASTSNIIH